MKIRPMNDNVLVLRVEEEQTTAGGIIIPDTAKKKPQEGKVIAVGSGKSGKDGKRIPLDVKAGNRNPDQKRRAHFYERNRYTGHI
jgi:chaperonin GroES